MNKTIILSLFAILLITSSANFTPLMAQENFSNQYFSLELPEKMVRSSSDGKETTYSYERNTFSIAEIQYSNGPSRYIRQLKNKLEEEGQTANIDTIVLNNHLFLRLTSHYLNSEKEKIKSAFIAFDNGMPESLGTCKLTFLMMVYPEKNTLEIEPIYRRSLNTLTFKTKVHQSNYFTISAPANYQIYYSGLSPRLNTSIPNNNSYLNFQISFSYFNEKTERFSKTYEQRCEEELQMAKNLKLKKVTSKKIQMNGYETLKIKGQNIREVRSGPKFCQFKYEYVLKLSENENIIIRFETDCEYDGIIEKEVETILNTIKKK